MTAIKKILIMLLFLFGAMTLFCYIGFHLGYDGLLLVGEVMLPLWLTYVIFTTVFGAQLLMIGIFSIQEYTKQGLKLITPCVIIFCSLYWIVPDSIHFLITGVFPYLYFIALGVYRKDLKMTILRVVIFSALIMVYQVLTLSMKTSGFHFGYNTLTHYEWYLWSLDLMLFIFVVYCIGGVKYATTAQCILCPEDIELAREDSDDRTAVDQFQKLTKYKKLAAMSLLLAVQVIQWIIILSVCYVGNVFIEGLVITTSFVAHGFVIKRRWHSNSLIVCVLVMSAIFYISAKITIAFTYSQLFPIILGLGIIYILYRVSLITDTEEICKVEMTVDKIRMIEKKMDKAWAKIDKISEVL